VSTGASSSPVEMLGLETDAPVDTREITFGPSGFGRSRRGIALGGLVTALVIGGIVAVSGSSKNAATPPSTAVPDTSTSQPPDSTTSTTEAPPTTTTSLPRRVAVNATAPLLGEATGLELWFQARFEAVGGAASSSGVYRVDLDNGTAEHVAPSVHSGDGPVNFATVDVGGYHLLGDGSTVIHRDGTTARTFTRFNSNVLISDADGLWIQNYDAVTGPRIERRRLDGTIESTLEVPSGSQVVTGAGRNTLVLGTADGRSFLFDTETRQFRPIVGSVVAANGGALVAVRCTDSLECSVIYVAADGSEHRLDVPVALIGGYDQTSLSPDGSWIVRTAFATDDGSQPISESTLGRITVSNPVSGERIDLGAISLAQAQQYGGIGFAGVWSPDGRWFFVPTPTGIHAWRPGLATPILVLVGDGVLHADTLAVGKSPAM
jgi:hypothetical protein